MKGENIYQRKDGRWEARYIKARMPNGKIKYGFCYGRTYKEAKEKREAKKLLLLQGQPSGINVERMFEDYCDEWLTSARFRVKDSTFVKYQSQLEIYVKAYFCGKNLSEINSKLIDQFTEDLLYKKGLSVKTTRDILVRLKSIIKMIVIRYPDKMKYVDISYPQLISNERRVLSIPEQKKLEQFLLFNMDKCKFGVYLSLYSGLRIGELCALKWSDISFEDDLIYVRKTMQRIKDSTYGKSKTRIQISSTKSKNSNRDIPLIQSVKRLCPLVYTEKDHYILTGTSRYMEPRRLQYIVKKYAEHCELEGVHFHCFRHTFATRCVEVGFDIKTLSEILGHSSIKLTMDLYVHSSMDLKRKNMDKLKI